MKRGHAFLSPSLAMRLCVQLWLLELHMSSKHPELEWQLW